MSDDTPLYITYVRLDSLTPAERNANVGDVEGIIRSIDDHGFLDAAVIDERTQRTVIGYHRWQALIEMRARGFRVPAGILVDDDGQWLMPLQRGWASADDSEAEALIFRHNYLTRQGHDDPVTAVQMLQDMGPDFLASIDVDMEPLLAQVNLDFPDITGHDEGEREDDHGRADAPPPIGQEEDSDVDDEQPATPPPSIQCPACGHKFERSL